MMAARYFKIVWPLIILLSVSLLLVSIPPDTRAQGPVLPTPTNIRAGHTPPPGPINTGGGQESSGGAPVVAGAALTGFVYDYSKDGPEAGVAVVVTGDGWQAEAISDSNGYYRLDGLGEGSGLVSLRLPPGAHPVVLAWPARFHTGAEVQLNLGYYWGDDPPLPVLASGALTGDLLTVQVENRTAEAATGGVIQIDTPADIKVLPEIESSQAVDMAYDPHQPRLKLASLAAGSTVTVKLGFNTGPTALRVIFTYDQQRTPQMLEITAEPGGQDLAQAKAVAIATPLSPSTPSAQPAGSVKSSQAAATSTSISVPTPTTAVTSTPAPAAPETPAPVTPTPAAQLPATGDSPAAGQVGQIALSIMMVVMLALAGWWSLRAKTLR